MASGSAGWDFPYPARDSPLDRRAHAPIAGLTSAARWYFDARDDCRVPNPACRRPARWYAGSTCVVDGSDAWRRNARSPSAPIDYPPLRRSAALQVITRRSAVRCQRRSASANAARADRSRAEDSTEPLAPRRTRRRSSFAGVRCPRAARCTPTGISSCRDAVARRFSSCARRRRPRALPRACRRCRAARQLDARGTRCGGAQSPLRRVRRCGAPADRVRLALTAPVLAFMRQRRARRRRRGARRPFRDRHRTRRATTARSATGSPTTSTRSTPRARKASSPRRCRSTTISADLNSGQAWYRPSLHASSRCLRDERVAALVQSALEPRLQPVLPPPARLLPPDDELHEHQRRHVACAGLDDSRARTVEPRTGVGRVSLHRG